MNKRERSRSRSQEVPAKESPKSQTTDSSSVKKEIKQQNKLSQNLKQLCNSNHLNSTFSSRNNLHSLEESLTYLDRKNIVIDIDRTFIDIIQKKDYDLLLTSQYKKVLNSHFQKFQEINFWDLEFVVAIRKGAIEFFQKLHNKFSFYLVTQMHRELALKLLDFIDPKGICFLRKDLRVIGIPQGVNKSTQDLLANEINKEDYLIIDRQEQVWDQKDQSRIILIKAFAPLTGMVCQEDVLKTFPISVKPLALIKLSEKYHLAYGEEVIDEKVLSVLAESLSSSFDISRKNDSQVIQELKSTTQKRFKDIKVSLAYIKGHKNLYNERDDLIQIINEILKRLNAIVVTDYNDECDIYIVDFKDKNKLKEYPELLDIKDRMKKTLVSVHRLINYFLRSK